MEYGWRNQLYNYWSTSNSYEDQGCNYWSTSNSYGDQEYNHWNMSMCSNPPYHHHYNHEAYYQPTPQVQEDVTQGNASQSRLEEIMLYYTQKTDTLLQNQQIISRNLEGHLSQIFQQLSIRPSGSLPSNAEENPKRVNTIKHFQEHCEIDDSPDHIGSDPVQPTTPKAPQFMEITELNSTEISTRIECFKGFWNSEVDSVSQIDPLKDTFYENVGVDDSKTDLMNILEVNDPFNSDCNEELQEELAVASNLQEYRSLHEEDVDENIQILDKKNGEVDPNIEKDFEPSPTVDEMRKVKLESVCLEFPVYNVDFEKAPIKELPRDSLELKEATLIEFPGYTIEFEEAQRWYVECIPGKIRGVKLQIELYWLRRKFPLNFVKLWVWDTFPWDPGG